MPTDAPTIAEVLEPVEVALERRDYTYYNWVLALERPILPFFLYTFTFLALLSLLGLWPDGRLYASAALLPMLAYAAFVWLTSRSLWPKLPEGVKRRRYRFFEDGYSAGGARVPYASLSRVLESRRALYLMHEGGQADILPKRLLPDEAGLAAFLKERVGEWKSSSFL